MSCVYHLTALHFFKSLILGYELLSGSPSNFFFFICYVLTPLSHPGSAFFPPKKWRKGKPTSYFNGWLVFLDLLFTILFHIVSTALFQGIVVDDFLDPKDKGCALLIACLRTALSLVRSFNAKSKVSLNVYSFHQTLFIFIKMLSELKKSFV
jgi:hypothetical protein